MTFLLKTIILTCKPNLGHMSDDCEYELNALCQELTKVLTDHEALTKTRSVYKVSYNNDFLGL